MRESEVIFTHKNNFPQGKLEDLPKETVKDMVTSLKELHSMGKPDTNDDLKDRIDKYFAFCESVGFRPGVESLCLALHISRVTLFNWAKGIGCDEERKEIVESAKAFIAAFLEQTVLAGKISPPSGIFLLKAWLSYSDNISLEFRTPEEPVTRPLTAAELPKLTPEFVQNTQKQRLPILEEEV